MKPTQEQVIAWARGAGYGDALSMLHSRALIQLATIAYEAGRKDENEACAMVCDEIEDKHGWSPTCAAAIRARREQ